MVYDAEAYLTAQGWRGKGHSLHATSDAVGLSRPLLVSQKQNTLGVGKKQHKTSDMWWMNAFDKSLKGLDTSKEGQVVQTVTSGALDMFAKGGSKYAGGKGGLYSCFIKGETLVGSVEEYRLLKEGNKMIVSEADLQVVKGEDGKKRKRTMETKEERRWRKLEKRTKRAAKAAKKAEKKAKKGESSSSSSSAKPVESKAERKERKDAKRLKKAKKAAKALLKVKAAEAKKASKEDRKRQKKLAEETKKSK